MGRFSAQNAVDLPWVARSSSIDEKGKKWSSQKTGFINCKNRSPSCKNASKDNRKSKRFGRETTLSSVIVTALR
jgi:hypothetical protein